MAKVVMLDNINLERLKSYKGVDGNTLLRRGEVSVILGIKVSTLFNWRKRPDILPYVKIGRTVRYRYIDVIEFLKKHQLESN